MDIKSDDKRLTSSVKLHSNEVQSRVQAWAVGRTSFYTLHTMYVLVCVCVFTQSLNKVLLARPFIVGAQTHMHCKLPD